jgi:hypothetical protein
MSDSFRIVHARAQGSMTDRAWWALSANERTTAIYQVFRAMDAENVALRALQPHPVQFRADDESAAHTFLKSEIRQEGERIR